MCCFSNMKVEEVDRLFDNPYLTTISLENLNE